MAKLNTPKGKLVRKLGVNIFGNPKFDRLLSKKGYGPGQHGPSKRRGKQSEYAVQLGEKQKAKYTYGILEKQFRNIYDKANKGKGITGELLLQLCESRLDNVVFRMGISNTRDGARQLVSHKHILVNGSIVNIPSYTLRPGDKVSIREKSKSLKTIESSLRENISEYEWIKFNRERLEGEFISFPEREQIPENIKEQLIVELYSK